MNDHRIKISDLLKKHNVNPVPKKTYVAVDNTSILKDTTRGKNIIFPETDHTLVHLFFETFMDPSNILTLICVSSLIVIYFFNKEEKQHLLVFLFTVTIMVIRISFEVFEEIRINSIYKRSLDLYDCRVIQGDKIFHVAKEMIRVGDILDLKRDDTVGADAVLIKSNNIKIKRNFRDDDNQIIKKTHTRSNETFRDSENVVLCGDRVVQGCGQALVVKIGKETEMGKLYTRFSLQRRFHSSLYSEMLMFFLGSLIFSLVLGTLLILIGIATGITIFSAMDILLSLVIAIIPEGVPSAVKLLLFSAVSKLEKKGVFIRDVGAVENLGLVTSVIAEKKALVPSSNLICSYVFDGHKMIDVELALSDNMEEPLSFLRQIGYITGLVSTSKDLHFERGYDLPLKILSDLCSRYFVDYTRMSTKIRDVKFKSMCGALVDDGDFKSVYITGSVESILETCNKLLDGGKKKKLFKDRKEKIINLERKMRVEGYESIALAFRSFGKSESHLRMRGLTFGCIYFIQEIPEADVDLATNIFKCSGIKFSVLTDAPTEMHLNSCRSILGIDERFVGDDLFLKINEPGMNQIRSSDAYRDMSDSEKNTFLKKQRFIVYGCDSDCRGEIVSDLQTRNHVVCYVGSGLNDSKALCQSNIGITFGDSNRISKEGSSMILKPQRFEDVIYSLEEGRLFFVNLQKTIRYIMMHITPQVVPFVLYAIFGTPISLSPILLIFLNYLVEVIPATFFSFEEPEYNLMLEQPRSQHEIVDITTGVQQISANPVLCNARRFINKLSRVMEKGILYRLAVLSWSILEAGMISSIGCVLAFYSVLYAGGVKFSMMFYSANTYFSYESPNLVLRDGRSIDFEQQLDLLYAGQSTYFLGLMICQFSNMLVCRREREYFFFNFFRNARILVFTLLGIAVSTFIVYVPFFENFLLIRRPFLIYLLYPTGSAILILVLDTARKFRAKCLARKSLKEDSCV